MSARIPVKYYNTYVLKKINSQPELRDFDYYVEEARIRGGYNNVQTGLSPRAFLISDQKGTDILGNSIIYSGVFNSRTGINQTNQFASGEDITRTVDPSNGTIQKLYAEDTNLIIFQERKVNKALIDKDAIYTQEGQPVQTASNVVIGGIIAYAGEWGISKNPESFAVYGYRKYFTDKDKGSVLRLSQDGITEISNYGMYDYFRDKFLQLGSSGKAVGGWDIHNKCYTLSFVTNVTNNNDTLSFDEQINGWTSRYSYIPTQMFSIQNNFYSTKDGSVYQHYSTGVNRANFYGTDYDSTVTTIFNTNPSLVKTFQTINYEGGSKWALDSFITNNTGTAPQTNQYVNSDRAASIQPFSMPLTLSDLESNYLKNQFQKKEDKYFANLNNITVFQQGEVTPRYLTNDYTNWPINGVKGFTATAVFKAVNDGDSGSNELFAVSTNYKESSY